MTIFADAEDYAAFERVLVAAIERQRMRLLAYCLMPNHFHLVLWPREDGDLSRFMAWLTLTHTQRWHAAHHTVGLGHLYQGRFKSFPIQQGGHLLRVCRYVERNPLRANLVRRAERWPWGSLARRPRRGEGAGGTSAGRPPLCAVELTAWPVSRPAKWVALVNQPQGQEELEAIRCCVGRGRPYGDPAWQQRAALRLGLASTFRPRGRPRAGKTPKKGS